MKSTHLSNLISVNRGCPELHGMAEEAHGDLQSERYLEDFVDPVIAPLLRSILRERPADVPGFVIEKMHELIARGRDQAAADGRASPISPMSLKTQQHMIQLRGGVK